MVSKRSNQLHTVLSTMNTLSVREIQLTRLYWGIRIGIAFIWLWTAYVCWFAFPHATELEWLARLGLNHQGGMLFAIACVFDFVMGVASLVYARRWLWLLQMLSVVFYTVAIVFGLPEFLYHPFGPITKNIAVLGCLAFLRSMERH